MTEFYLHEAWCPRCHVSHPPGTKRCLHCGGGVLPVRPVVGSAPMTTREMERFELPAPMPGDEPAEATRRANPLRIGFATLWIVLAIAASILRSCSERG